MKMKFDRRDILLGMPGGLAALALFAEDAQTQTGGVTADPDAVNFWKKMGVPANALPKPGNPRPVGPNRTSGLAPGEKPSAEDLEPFFFYYDKDAKVLMPASQIKPEQMDNHRDKGADAKVTFVKRRVRFGESDKALYEKYSASAFYLETQQHPSAPTPDYGQLGWSLLSSVLPSFAKKPATKGGGPAPAAPPAGANPAAAAAPAKPGAPNAAITPPPNTQVALLPNGIGQSSFYCFLKDRRQSRFGLFLNALIPPTSLAQPFAPLLSMPAIAQGALGFVRTMVGVLSSHPAGDQGDQLAVVQQAMLDIAATQECPLAGSDSSLKVRSGTYVVVPKYQAGLLSGKYADYKIYDGYLVGKNVDEAGTYDAWPETLKPMTYLTLDVSVERTHLGCTSGPGPAKG